MKGFHNRLMTVDLAAESVEFRDLPDELLQRTLGGKGLGVHLLLEENPIGVDPLSPENIFVLTTGPATGTRMWGSARFGAFTKSPATGGYGESYCGGTLAPLIKGCGVDAIILKGACFSLKFLVFDESGVSFRDASEIKGRDAYETEEYIFERSADGAGALSIGPAGENLVALACVKVNRWRSLGRGGMGAVLGAKNVKGMSFNGKLTCEIADEETVKSLAKAVTEKSKEMPVTEVYRKQGTPMQVAVTNTMKCFPARYWQTGVMKGWENISDVYMRQNFEVKSCGCPTCLLRCTKLSTLKEGRHAGLVLEGPEFETIYAIGGLNEIDSLEEIAWLNDLCDRWGIDTMSAGNLAAFAIEAYKAGKTAFEIDYNQPEKVAELLRMIVDREGLGDLLARGIKPASEELGLEDIAVHVKGLEPGGFDPRVLKGMGLSYATSARGACHLRGTFYKAELSGQMDPGQIEGKAALHIDYEDRSALFDCMVLCRFFRDFVLWEELGTLIRGTTGMDLDKDALSDLANNITNATRRYNTREGLGPETDTLPPFLLDRENAEGGRLTPDELSTMLAEYNAIRAREA